MTPEELDRILSSDDRLEPSAGFAMDVMDAVRRQLTQPPPLRFPWFRFGTGVAACCIMVVSATALLPRAILPEVAYSATVLLLTLAFVSLPRLLDRV